VAEERLEGLPRPVKVPELSPKGQATIRGEQIDDATRDACGVTIAVEQLIQEQIDIWDSQNIPRKPGEDG
jgi:hypothetical protein